MKQQKPSGKGIPSHHLIDRAAHQVSHHRLSISLRLVIGLLFLIGIGSVLLSLPGMAVSGRLTPTQAIFTATSALTVTGLSIITPATDLTTMGQTVLLLLIQIGGVGFMFVAIILLRLIGRRILLSDRMALANSLGLESPQAIMKLLRWVFISVIGIEALGALLLWLHWLRYFSPVKALGYAIFHTVSAFCHAGFDLFNGATAKDGTPFNGLPSDNLSLAILGALIFVGGLGIPVIGDLIAFRKHKRLAVNTRVTLYTIAILTLAGWLAMLLSESSGVLEGQPLANNAMQTLFQSLSNRTAGFAGLPNFGRISPASLIVIMVMMFIGCAPASMGGGITTGTFSVLAISLVGYVRGQPRPTIWRRSIDSTTVQRAGTILTISLGLLALSTWLILLTHPTLRFDQALFEVVSAFATCGLSLGVTGELNGFGRTILVVLMFWGRLGPLSIVIAVAQRRSHTSHLVRYPEEQILIG